MLNYTKVMFFMVMIISSLITINSNSWLGMWMGMEMNLMSFIPLISKNKNKKSSQAMIIYFLSQSIGSIMFLFSILMNMFLIWPTMMNTFLNELLTISILIKLGAAPFHLWLPEMMSNLNWIEVLLLSTWQKLAPLFVLYSISTATWVMMSSVILSSMVGSIGGVMFTSLRKILAYSSINHMSWMIMMLNIQSQWYMYLTIYSMLMTSTCYWFYKNNYYFMNQMMKKSSVTEKLMSSMLLLSLGGMPPMLGFLPKWIAIQTMISTNMIFVMVIMIMSSMLTLFYYMRMISLFILLFSSINKWSMKTSNSLTLLIMFIINLALPMFLVINFI